MNVKAEAARVLVAAAKAAPAATESPRRAGVDVPDVSRADEFACGVKSGSEAARCDSTRFRRVPISQSGLSPCGCVL